MASSDGVSRTASLGADLGGGLHMLAISPAVAAGEQVKVTLSVTADDDGCPAEFTVWVGHLPGDINQDDTVGISDVGQYGIEFRKFPAPLIMVDHDGDGVLSASDPGSYGATFNGFLGSDQWNGISLNQMP